MPRPTGLARIMADAALKLQQYAATRYERGCRRSGDRRHTRYLRRAVAGVQTIWCIMPIATTEARRFPARSQRPIRSESRISNCSSSGCEAVAPPSCAADARLCPCSTLDVQPLVIESVARDHAAVPIRTLLRHSAL